MAVVINEFEVVPHETPQNEKGSGADQGGDKKSSPSDQEIERMVEHQMSRGERVWAH